MKMIKMSALVLVSGLFFASCGDGANEETPVDTTQMNMEAMPDTVNGIDTTVNTGGRDNSTSMNGATSTGGGSNTTTSGGQASPDANNGDPNSTSTSTSGKPTENPAKAPGNGHPASGPEKKNGTSPNM